MQSQRSTPSTWYTQWNAMKWARPSSHTICLHRAHSLSARTHKTEKDHDKSGLSSSPVQATLNVLAFALSLSLSRSLVLHPPASNDYSFVFITYYVFLIPDCIVAFFMIQLRVNSTFQDNKHA